MSQKVGKVQKDPLLFSAENQKVPKIQKVPNFKFFPIRSELGGPSNFKMLPNSKKSKLLDGRGLKKIVDFLHFL